MVSVVFVSASGNMCVYSVFATVDQYVQVCIHTNVPRPKNVLVERARVCMCVVSLN